MKKLIDFDALFEEKLAQYMRQNAGKYTEKQWESLIPKLYKTFGDTFIGSAGATPKGYYAAMTDAELVEMLEAHFREGVPVSDFLCREIENRGCPDELLPLLGTENEELLTLAVNLAGDNPKAFDAYFGLLERANPDVKEAVTDVLKSNAEAAKERALSLYEAGTEREIMLEILSRTSCGDDRVFDILMREFRTASEELLPMHASYLASYGDERALPVLLETIARDDINYIEYRELKYAIEALGGEYNEIRDFSDDKYFREIAGQSQILPDFTSDKPQ